MNIDGTTPQTFYISSNLDYDLYITHVVAIIADTAIVHNKFGNVDALTNGWSLYVRESGVKTYLIEEAKTGGQVLAQSGLMSPYGDLTSVNELANWTGTEDAQTITMPVTEFVPGGIRIGRGTQDRIVSLVQDDLQGLTEFTVRVLGYRHYDI
jgi:hypothetical protein